jgi:hypothetical protein
MANNKNNIDKALEALTGALEIEPTGEEVQLEPDTGDKNENENIELTDDGGANVNLDPNAPMDTSNVPHDANLAERPGSCTPYSLNLLRSFKPKRIRNFSPQAAPFAHK